MWTEEVRRDVFEQPNDRYRGCCARAAIGQAATTNSRDELRRCFRPVAIGHPQRAVHGFVMLAQLAAFHSRSVVNISNCAKRVLERIPFERNRKGIPEGSRM
jgi:hypothetical protein